MKFFAAALLAIGVVAQQELSLEEPDMKRLLDSHIQQALVEEPTRALAATLADQKDNMDRRHLSDSESDSNSVASVSSESSASEDSSDSVASVSSVSSESSVSTEDGVRRLSESEASMSEDSPDSVASMSEDSPDSVASMSDDSPDSVASVSSADE